MSLVNGMINGHEKPMDTGAMEILTLKEELERINAEFIQVCTEDDFTMNNATFSPVLMAK